MRHCCTQLPSPAKKHRDWHARISPIHEGLQRTLPLWHQQHSTCSRFTHATRPINGEDGNNVRVLHLLEDARLALHLAIAIVISVAHSPFKHLHAKRDPCALVHNSEHRAVPALAELISGTELVDLPCLWQASLMCVLKRHGHLTRTRAPSA